MRWLRRGRSHHLLMRRHQGVSRVLTHIVGCGSSSACSATRRDWAVCDACVMGNSMRCDAWEDAAAVRVRVGSPMSCERSPCNLLWLCAMRHRQHRECHARHTMRRQRCTRLCDCACVDTGHSIHLPSSAGHNAACEVRAIYCKRKCTLVHYRCRQVR
jgi:hypothetical protein